ncbi:MAG: NAD(P)-binding domain-containing protein, partial [Pirellulaceae bacterium]
MAVDTPATIAIIGAGPIGLEAALYARFLGYDVLVFEQGLVAESVQRWGHVEMFTPFSMNCSPLGVAAIQAQGSTELPSEDQLLTGCQWRTRYLIPLAQTDLLAASIHQRTNVVKVGRQSVLKHEMPGAAERATSRFRILVDGVNGEAVHQADIVIDCSGVLGVANWLGSGGGPAVGELALIDHIDHLPPDVLG